MVLKLLREDRFYLAAGLSEIVNLRRPDIKIVTAIGLVLLELSIGSTTADPNRVAALIDIELDAVRLVPAITQGVQV